MLKDLIQPRVAELGKIKIGKKEDKERKAQGGGTWRAPMKLDHFIITTLQRDATDNLIVDEGLMASLAPTHADSDGKLRQLPIAVLSNDLDDIMQAAYVAYNGKQLAARSDGRTLTVYWDFNKRVWLDQPKIVDWEPSFTELTDSKGRPRFKLSITLNVVIASAQARWGGFYKFRTTSQITASQLYGSLLHLRELTGGILRGMPLRLVLRPMIVTPEGITTTVYVVHLELVGPELMALQKHALERAKLELENRQTVELMSREYKQLVAAPAEGEIVDDDEDDEDDEDPTPPPITPRPGSSADAKAALSGGAGDDDEPTPTNTGTAAATGSATATATATGTGTATGTASGSAKGRAGEKQGLFAGQGADPRDRPESR